MDFLIANLSVRSNQRVNLDLHIFNLVITPGSFPSIAATPVKSSSYTNLQCYTSFLHTAHALGHPKYCKMLHVSIWDKQFGDWLSVCIALSMRCTGFQESQLSFRSMFPNPKFSSSFLATIRWRWDYFKGDARQNPEQLGWNLTDFPSGVRKVFLLEVFILHWHSILQI